MPKIPQYIAQQGIKTGPVADQINVGAMTAPAAAIGSFAGAAQDVGAFFDSRQKERELRWSGDAEYKFTNAMTEWHMANKDREDYGPAFKEHSEKILNDFVSAAPSKRAGDVLKRQLQGSIARQYDTALRVGEDNRFKNFELSEHNSTQAYMEMFRQGQAVDPEGASLVIEGQLAGQLARINEAFAEKAPAFALKMRGQAVRTAIEGVMDTDPDLAEILLMGSKDIPENFRQGKLEQINQSRKQLRILDARAFQSSIEDGIANAQERGQYATLPGVDTFKAIYPTEPAALAAYDSYKEQVDVHNTALDFIKDLSGMAPNAMQRGLESTKDKVGGVVGQKARAEAGRMIKALSDFANDNPVEYLQNYNPTVSKMRQLYAGATDQNRAAMFTQLNAETLRYQGHAPAGAPDAEYYLGLDAHQASVVPKAQAEQFAGNINNGTPDAKVKAIQDFEAMYAGDPQVAAIAWRDLTQLPEGKRVSQQAQLLKLHYKEPYARQLAEALGKANENAKNKGLKIDEYEKTLVTNKDWLAFASMYGGDNKQNAAMVAGFREAIVSYAASLDISNPAQAVKKSIETLVGNKFQFEDVGDQTIPFAKWAGPDERMRSDSEMKEAVTRVRDNFDSTIMASGLMQTMDNGAPLWPLAPYNATQQAIDTYIQNDVNKNKMLVPSEDGKGMYVYMKTELGIPVQLRTKDKRPLFISFDVAGKRHNMPLRQEVQRTGLKTTAPELIIKDDEGNFIDPQGNYVKPPEQPRQINDF